MVMSFLSIEFQIKIATILRFRRNRTLRRTSPARVSVLLLAVALCCSGNAFAQKNQRQPIRPGKELQQKPAISAIQRVSESKLFGESRKLRILTIRLRPGDDLRQRIEQVVKTHHIRAGFLLTAVGSLSGVNIRLADQNEATTFAGKFEIVSLVGTMGQDGVHLHISIADNTGKTIGGHLVEGCLVYTTAEIVIGEAQGLVFSREQDEQTGYKELRIRRSGH